MAGSLRIVTLLLPLVVMVHCQVSPNSSSIGDLLKEAAVTTERANVSLVTLVEVAATTTTTLPTPPSQPEAAGSSSDPLKEKFRLRNQQLRPAFNKARLAPSANETTADATKPAEIKASSVRPRPGVVANARRNETQEAAGGVRRAEFRSRAKQPATSNNATAVNGTLEADQKTVDSDVLATKKRLRSRPNIFEKTNNTAKSNATDLVEDGGKAVNASVTEIHSESQPVKAAGAAGGGILHKPRPTSRAFSGFKGRIATEKQTTTTTTVPTTTAAQITTTAQTVRPAKVDDSTEFVPIDFDALRSIVDSSSNHLEEQFQSTPHPIPLPTIPLKSQQLPHVPLRVFLHPEAGASGPVLVGQPTFSSNPVPIKAASQETPRDTHRSSARFQTAPLESVSARPVVVNRRRRPEKEHRIEAEQLDEAASSSSTTNARSVESSSDDAAHIDNVHSELPWKFQVTVPAKKIRNGDEIQVVDRYKNDNSWGYKSADGSFKEETIGEDCITRGRYGYVDPQGEIREFKYETGVPCDPLTKEVQRPKVSKSNGARSGKTTETGYFDYSDNRFVMPDGRRVTVVVNKDHRARG